MQITCLILSVVAIVIALVSILVRKPGPKGDPGKDGIDGDTPTFMIEGKNLYVRYLNSVTGESTEWKFLAKVVGDDGKNGAPGGKGPKGDKGDQGDPGKDGKDGKDGEVILKEAGDLTGTDIEKLLAKKQKLNLPKTSISALSFHESK